MAKFSFKRAQEIIDKYGPNSPEYFAYQARTHPKQSGAGTPVSPAAGSGAAAPRLISPEVPTVGPHLTADQYGSTLDFKAGLRANLIGSDQDLANMEAEDPFIHAKIADTYNRSMRHETEGLAARGVSYGGIAESVLTDVDRHRTLADAEQVRVLGNARALNAALHKGVEDQEHYRDLGDVARQNENAVTGTPAQYAGPDGKPYTPSIVGAPKPAPAPGPAAGAPAKGGPSGPSPGPGFQWSGTAWVRTGPSPGKGYKWDFAQNRWRK